MKKSKFDTYNKSELEILQEGGSILREILSKVKDFCAVGKTTKEVDIYAEKLIKEKGALPVFKNYKPKGAPYPYPSSSCISVNEVVAHGIPGERVLCDGDLVSLDIGIRYKGLVVDSAISFGIGNLSKSDEKLLKVTKEALQRAISVVRSGVYINEIGKTIEKYARSQGFAVVAILCGHAVGREIHADPQIPHIDIGEKGEKLVEGMVIALEPHITKGSGNISLAQDGWTYVSDDGHRTAQFEHTIYVDRDSALILT